MIGTSQLPSIILGLSDSTIHALRRIYTDGKFEVDSSIVKEVILPLREYNEAKIILIILILSL